MSRLTAKFDELAHAGRKALIPFLTAGDPEPGMTVRLMHDMVAAGADILELGVPFSDPMADGPVIQRASERALRHRVGLRDVFSMVASFREQDQKTPVVLMGYLNPVECYGYENFARDAGQAGIDGLLTVDMPPEEAGDFVAQLKQQEIDPVFLLAPNSTPERIRKIGEVSSGYLYYVSLKGVTGAANLDLGNVAAKLDEIRSLVPLPVAVGFGVKNAETAASVAEIADAVVVGSQLISFIEQDPAQSVEVLSAKISALLAEMRAAMDSSAVQKEAL